MENLRLPRIEKSLCGCSLTTGSKIIAYIHLIPLASIGILAFVASAYEDYKYYKRVGHEPTDEFSIVFFRDQFEISFIFLYIVLSVLLLCGIHKKYSILIEPFIILKATGLLMKVINLMTLFIARFQGRKSMHLFSQLTLAGLQWYMFIVIYNFRREVLTGGP